MKIKLYKNIFLLFLILNFSNFSAYAENTVDTVFNKNKIVTFSLLKHENTVGEIDYFDFLRSSIITQPEFLFANLQSIEKSENLKYAQRQRWPELNARVINDHALDRDIDDITSIRKRRDDSFDAVVELSQPIYSGGTINAEIRKARYDHNLSNIEKENALSNLILDANKYYLSAVKSKELYDYGIMLIDEMAPYLEKVKERVDIGITDPIELALFSIKFNALKSRIQILKTQQDRDIAIFEYFFEKKFSEIYFPEVSVMSIRMNNSRETYNVKGAKIKLNSAKEETKIIKGEFRPQLGFNTRYTRYDLDEDENDSDIRGGVYFSMPLFTFGRARAKISSYKAKENATQMNIDIERKADEVGETEIVNIVQSAINTRSEIFSSFKDTQNQRRIIKNRLDSTAFSAESYVNSGLEEINLLEEFLDVEIRLLHGYFTYLHQNQGLNNLIRVSP